ncbi:MAG: hypothetical protein PVI86_10000 [Phycisphaerae bacterium]|jgi:hypothetical protein
MRQRRLLKWICLTTVAGSTLYLGCAGAIVLELADSTLRGAYQSASQFGARVAADVFGQIEDRLTGE